MSKGNLIDAAGKHLWNFIEALDGLGVTPRDLEAFRKENNAKQREVIGRLLRIYSDHDGFLWELIGAEETLRKAGFDARTFMDIADSDSKTRAMLDFLQGAAKVEPIVHVLNGSAPPANVSINIGDPVYSTYVEFAVVKHNKLGNMNVLRKGNRLYVNGREVILRAPENLKKAMEFAKTIKEDLFLNVNFADYLLEHPELIPDDWKARWNAIYFFGTFFARACAGNTEKSDPSYFYVRSLENSPGIDWLHGSFANFGGIWLGERIPHSGESRYVAMLAG